MIKCPYCDADNLPNAIFCCMCGTRIEQKRKESLSSRQWVVLISLGLSVICVFGVLVLVLASNWGQPQKVVIQPTSTAVPTRGPTRTPAPTPKPTATLTSKQRMSAYYPMDPRDLAKSPGGYVGQKIKVFGQVFDIAESTGGTVFQILSCPSHFTYSGVSFVETPKTCREAPYRGQAPYPHESLVVVYQGRTDGLYKESWVAVYGRVMEPVTGTNAWGVELTRPGISADHLLYPLDLNATVNQDW